MKQILHLPHFTSKMFVVGDIHGYKSLLLEALNSVDFDFDTDILVSVGDLIDRGPENYECAMLLEEDWFLAVRGNHEEMFLSCKWHLPESDLIKWEALDRQLHLKNGGTWVMDHTPQQHQEMFELFSRLPIVLDIHLPQKRIGVIHAQYPLFRIPSDWDHFVNTEIEDPFELMWGEDISLSLANAEEGLFEDLQPSNVDLIFHGHRFDSSHQIRKKGKFVFLDTGVYHQRDPKQFSLWRVM